MFCERFHQDVRRLCKKSSSAPEKGESFVCIQRFTSNLPSLATQHPWSLAQGTPWQLFTAPNKDKKEPPRPPPPKKKKKKRADDRNPDRNQDRIDACNAWKTAETTVRGSLSRACCCSRSELVFTFAKLYHARTLHPGKFYPEQYLLGLTKLSGKLQTTSRQIFGLPCDSTQV